MSAKRPAFGGVVVDGEGRVLLRKPRGHYGGYVWTFPKGRPDGGEGPEAAALREVREETGLDVEIVAPIPGAFVGDETSTRMWLMRVVRAGGVVDEETAEIAWVTFDEAPAYLNQTTSPRGRERDLAILAAARAVWSAARRGAWPARRCRSRSRGP